MVSVKNITFKYPKNEVRYLEDIFSESKNIFSPKGVFVTKVIKGNIIASVKTKILSVTNTPFTIFLFSNFWGVKRAFSKNHVLDEIWQRNQLPKLNIS